MSIEYHEVYFLAKSGSSCMLMVHSIGRDSDLGNQEGNPWVSSHSIRYQSRVSHHLRKSQFQIFPSGKILFSAEYFFNL